MRVIIAGSDIVQINKIAVETFLNGLYASQKDKLYVIYTGRGHVSDIAEEWVDKTWRHSVSKFSFNGEWLIEHWSEGITLSEVGFHFIEETNPDLIFLFGEDHSGFSDAARRHNIPSFILEKIS